ncbi:unnamed protein product [Dracunculus medinensis]|uniref:Uncharacterized protein n=1 Tax=Dracunculus medinensis TaxID=318479 RepID=A0A0N4U7X5_DRAME|nr:unnamed protein product [Dracunculus medinensis]
MQELQMDNQLLRSSLRKCSTKTENDNAFLRNKHVTFSCPKSPNAQRLKKIQGIEAKKNVVAQSSSRKRSVDFNENNLQKKKNKCNEGIIRLNEVHETLVQYSKKVSNVRSLIQELIDDAIDFLSNSVSFIELCVEKDFQRYQAQVESFSSAMKKYDAIVAGMDIRLNELKKIYENTAELKTLYDFYNNKMDEKCRKINDENEAELPLAVQLNHILNVVQTFNEAVQKFEKFQN